MRCYRAQASCRDDHTLGRTRPPYRLANPPYFEQERHFGDGVVPPPATWTLASPSARDVLPHIGGTTR